jgi:small subunit ribosomal protein S9
MATTKKEAGEAKVAKAPAKKPVAAKKLAAARTEGTYLGAVGRRKTAVATVKLWISGDGAILVNGADYKEYFKLEEEQADVLAPLKAVGLESAHVEIRCSGGGPRGQAEAARLGVTRALLKENPEFRLTLKPLGFLTRDPREKERKKPGLRRARKAPQWSKR